MVGKAPIYKLSRRKKTRNAANLDKNQWTCFVVQHGHRPLTSAIIFLTQVSLQKFPFLFIIMIPWLHNLLQSIIPWSLARYIFLLACIDSWKVYNWLVSACTVKTAIQVKCLCVSTSKKTTLLSGFFVSHCLFCLRAPQLIRGKQLFNFFCHYKHTRKNLPSWHSCWFLIPWKDIYHCWSCLLASNDNSYLSVIKPSKLISSQLFPRFCFFLFFSKQDKQ